jgi:putative ABC transport system substrate-binding protein
MARAQQAGMPVVGVLHGGAAAEWKGPTAGLRAGLGDTGFVEGRNVAIEYRWAENQFDRMPAMAADLIAQKVTVIFVGGNTTGVRATVAATKVIPIVFTTQTDPVAAGLVASLNRPGGNVTGVTGLGVELGPKLLGIFHEMIPIAGKFEMLVNPRNPVFSQDQIRGVQIAAQRLGLDILFLNATTQDEITSAFATAAEQGVGGILSTDAFFESQRDQIATLGLRYKLATATGGRSAAVAAGTLMSYGASNIEFYRQAGTYIGRILKGEKPADLPVLQPTKFDLSINLKTAKALGIVVPQSLLAIADEVIE